MLCLLPIDAREVISRGKLMQIDLVPYLSAKEPNYCPKKKAAPFTFI